MNSVDGFRRTVSAVSKWKLLGLAILALACLQCFLWAAVGIPSLPYYVGGMIEQDIAEANRILAEKDEPLPLSDSTYYWILCDKLTSKIGRTRLAELNQLVGPWNHEILTSDDAATIPDLRSGDPDAVDDVCYYIDVNTPLYAYVEYGKRNCALCSWGTGHRAWFVLGIWIPTEAVTSWVS